MPKPTTDTTSAIMAAEQTVWRLDSQVCDQCQDQCWSVQGEASGALSNGLWTTTVTWIDHVGLGVALAALSRNLGQHAGKVRQREAMAALIETQQTLW